MDASLYHPLYLWVTGALAAITAFSYIGSNERNLPSDESETLKTQFPLILLYGLILAIFLGGRPISGRYFGDTSNYAHTYDQIDVLTFKLDFTGEWVWELIAYLCVKMHMDVNQWFTVIDLIYFTTVITAGAILMPKGPWAAGLFILISLSFYSFGVNGIRNGAACHLLVLGIVMVLRGNYYAGVILAALCFGIHHSTMLPILACAVAMFTWRIPGMLKYVIWFWIASIGISLVAGTQVTEFFTSLGFDDRMSSYNDGEEDMEKFSHAGFRWDFLIYSAMPVVMCWYIAIKKQMADNWFTVLGITYCLCNAFWVMVNRAAYSNRFAYLSWFIYPFVIAYPLFNIKAWENQGEAIGIILLAYTGFTFFMEFVYW